MDCSSMNDLLNEHSLKFVAISLLSPLMARCSFLRYFYNNSFQARVRAPAQI
jgi:hypothetical protein